MAVNAIDNSNLTPSPDTTGFSPKVTYTYDAVAKEVDATDESTYPTGSFIKKVHVRVHDKFGGEVRGTITEQPGSGNADDITIDTSTLNASKPFDITATVLVDDNRMVADGGAYDIGAAGELGSWDTQLNGQASWT